MTSPSFSIKFDPNSLAMICKIFILPIRARRNSMNPSHIDSHEIKARKSMKKTITKIGSIFV